MSLQSKTRYTVPEYLELEAATPEKHEYLAGEIFAMGGASEAHNLIVGNVLSGLHQQLRGKPSRVYPSDLRVQVSWRTSRWSSITVDKVVDAGCSSQRIRSWSI